MPSVLNLADGRDAVRNSSVDEQVAADEPLFCAWCFADAVIYLGAQTPAGATEIVRGPEQLVRDFLRVVADTSAWTSSLVVPGMFEEPDLRESYAVLRRWMGWCATKDGSGQLLWNVSGRTTL